MLFNISFIGVPPFVTYNPVGGSEFKVMSILAKKFKIIPNYIPARSFDGNVHMVSMFHANRKFFADNLLGVKVGIMQFDS